MSSSTTARRLLDRVPPRLMPVLVLLLVLVAFGLTRLDPGPSSDPVAAPSASAGPSTSAGPSASAGRSTPTASAGTSDPGPRLAPAEPVSSLRTVRVDALPAEARRTLALIARGGPYPYSRDGVVFGNRERLLPAHPSGWYQEYTVVTPGSSDRGARRVVAGRDGGRFYTDDHYDSFREVLQ